ncbi:origin recognition complex subunit 1-like isoform X2 [Hylaeus volcanicus]|uniref:origin recognition complex subunit 1-like isoform X2 n=1 Tax=Hylaeus volcanicus TaxID=313075 RepID=UPI0023B82969|nr:origin recognition complex subunit 1-like isoform X2 [Hylaeus volcanicus]
MRSCKFRSSSLVFEDDSNLTNFLPGRETQLNYLTKFLENFLKYKNTVVSGVPGTGKTATVSRALVDLKHIPFQLVFVNGMEITRPITIYQEIYRQLFRSKQRCPNSSQCLSLLDQFFRSSSEKTFTEEPNKESHSRILVIDEIDHLFTRDQKVIYTLLEWPNIPTASLCLIAISNIMNLPDLFQTRCSSRLGSNRLDFNAYTAQEIFTILQYRLSNLYPDGKFSRVALEFCAKKVSGYSGDIRRAFYICQKAKQIQEEQDACNEVTMKHIKVAEDYLYQQPEFEFLLSLPLLPKLLLTTLVLMIKEKEKSGEPFCSITLTKLAARFNTLATSCSLGHLFSCLRPASSASLTLVKKLLETLQEQNIVLFHQSENPKSKKPKLSNSGYTKKGSNKQQQLNVTKETDRVPECPNENLCTRLCVELDVVVSALSRTPICFQKLQLSI